MVVQHNLTAMNSNRMLGITQETLSKSTEKLCSGYKVNRAADDAAGLSISEEMKNEKADQRSDTGIRKRGGRHQRSADGRRRSDRST